MTFPNSVRVTSYETNMIIVKFTALGLPATM